MKIYLAHTSEDAGVKTSGQFGLDASGVRTPQFGFNLNVLLAHSHLLSYYQPSPINIFKIMLYMWIGYDSVDTQN